jgi:hypothetical protein
MAIGSSAFYYWTGRPIFFEFSIIGALYLVFGALGFLPKLLSLEHSTPRVRACLVVMILYGISMFFLNICLKPFTPHFGMIVLGNLVAFICAASNVIGLLRTSFSKTG